MFAILVKNMQSKKVFNSKSPEAPQRWSYFFDERTRSNFAKCFKRYTDYINI